MVFNIFNIDAECYMTHEEVTEICTRLGLEQVPVIYKGLAKNIDLSVKAFLKMAEQQEYDKGVLAEGIVVKTADNSGPRVSFKVISNAFLLKHKH